MHVSEKDGKFFVSAEIPSVDLADRPVFYKEKGCLKGSYTRGALETLHVTENRYSGIPTIRREIEKYDLKEPKFTDERGSFSVTIYKSGDISKTEPELEEVNNLLVFCRTPRTRKEICEYLGLSSVTYAIQTYVMPLVENGKIKMTIPEKPKSSKQLFYSE